MCGEGGREGGQGGGTWNGGWRGEWVKAVKGERCSILNSNDAPLCSEKAALRGECVWGGGKGGGTGRGYMEWRLAGGMGEGSEGGKVFHPQHQRCTTVLGESSIERCAGTRAPFTATSIG